MAKNNIEAWNPKQILQLKSLWVLCKARYAAHEYSYRYFNKLNTIVSLPSILVGAVLSTLSFKPEDAPAGVNAGCAIFMTLMTTTGTFFQFSKKAEGHRQTYRGFNLLLREMEMCILRGRESPKREFGEFLEYINDKMTDLISDAPTLDRKGSELLKKNKIDKPSPFDHMGVGGLGIEKINIEVNEEVNEGDDVV